MDQLATDKITQEVMNNSPTALDKIINVMILDPTRTETLVLWLFLAMLLIGCFWLLNAWSKDESNDIKAADLICTDGKLNESKMARFGAFIVSTWAFVFLIATDRMTEWYFVGYMAAWVSNALVSKYMSDKNPRSDDRYSRGSDTSDNTSDSSDQEDDLSAPLADTKKRKRHV